MGSDAVSFLKNSMGAGMEEKAQVEELKKENDELKAKIKELEESNSQLELKIKEGSAPTPVVAAEPSPVAETPAEKLEEETKKDKESEETKDDEKKELKAKIEGLEESNSQLELKIKEGSAPTPVVAAEPSPVAETPAEKLEEETKKDKESEETKD